MATTVSLAQMVDLALGSPEVGAVNFNVLHTLLHAMLTKLDLTNITTELSPEDRDLLSSKDTNKTGLGEGTKTEGLTNDGKDADTTGQDGKQGGGVATKRSTPYHALQEKVARLEEQMQKLNELPSNEDLFERAKNNGEGERPRPVADMWQNVQIKNRVDANEEGIGKLMSLVEDLMAEMTKVKDDNKNLRTDLDNHNIPGLRTDVEDLKKKLEDLDIQSLRDFMDQLKKELEKLTNRMNNMADLDELRKRLKDLETLANTLNDQLSKYPSPESFIDYVTWKALEEALSGLRADLEPKERIVIEMTTQTSRPPSAKEPSRPPSSTGPSEELQRILEDLGLLTNRHEKIEVRVDKLEEEMPNKADKADLAGLSTGGPVDVPDDLLAQLKDLQDQLKTLSKARDKLSELEEKLSQLPDLAGIEENIDGLNLGQDDLQNMLDALRNEYESNMTALEDKLNSLQELAMGADVEPQPPPTPPREPSPTVKLPPIPGASPPPDNSGKLSDLESALSKKDSEMRAMQQKIKWLMSDTNKQVGDVKDKLKNLEKELINFAKPREPKKLPSPVRSKTSDMVRKRTSHTANANTSTTTLPQLSPPDSIPVTPTHSAPSTAPHAAHVAVNQVIPAKPSTQASTPVLPMSTQFSTPQAHVSTPVARFQESQASFRSETIQPFSREGPQEVFAENPDAHLLDSDQFEFPGQENRDMHGGMSEYQDSVISVQGNQASRRVSSKGFRKYPNTGPNHSQGYLRTHQNEPNYEKKAIEPPSSDSDTNNTDPIKASSPVFSDQDYKRQSRLVVRIKDPLTIYPDHMESNPDQIPSKTHISEEPSNADDSVVQTRSLTDLSVSMPSSSRGTVILKPIKGRKGVSTLSFGKPYKLSASSTDSEALSRLQQIVLQLQAELDRLNQAAQRLTDENNNQTKQIEGLMTTSDKLDRIKADKEYVQSEVDVKADKRLVENKVNRSLFDQTTDELNKMIKELLDKLGGKEDEWKKALGTINEDVDGKLDRLEFGPIRDELERRLKALARQLRELSLRDGDVEDDAAGIRKQLLQRYNCISCDRPVDMMPQGPIPSIPAPAGLPPSRSTRPYTTFELEQIRQHARSCRDNASNFERAVLCRHLNRCRKHGLHVIGTSQNEPETRANILHIEKDLQQPGVEVVDLYATQRACGGTHTMTQAHRRITRVAQFNNLFRDDEVVAAAPVCREHQRPGIEELDIQGADGHIYKGRLEARLPTTLQQSAPGILGGPNQSGQSPKMSRKVVYAQAGAPRPPATAPGPVPPGPAGGSRSPPRPSSARNIKPSPIVPKQATIPTAGVVEATSEPPANKA